MERIFEGDKAKGRVIDLGKTKGEACLVLLHANEVLAFHGEVKMVCVRGAFQLMGAMVSAPPPSQKVPPSVLVSSSPFSCGPVCLRSVPSWCTTKHDTIPRLGSEHSEYFAMGLREMEEAFSHEWQEWSACESTVLVLLSCPPSPQTSSVERMHPPKGWKSESCIDLPGFFVTGSSSLARFPWMAPQMDRLPPLLSHCFRDTETLKHPEKVAVVGPQKVGKSTVVKYITNAFLNQAHVCGVAILDIDLGQPLFGPPACVSLTLVRAPITEAGLVLNHTRHSSTFHFVGTISPRDPTYYMACIANLYEKYQKASATCAKALPLVVNTHGWIEGLGRSTIEQTLSLVCPHTILLLEKEGCTAPRLHTELPHLFEAEYTVLCTGAPFETPVLSDAKNNRAVRLTHCLGQPYSRYVYSVECSPHLRVHVQETPPACESMRCLNGQVVALVNDKSAIAEPEGSSPTQEQKNTGLDEKCLWPRDKCPTVMGSPPLPSLSEFLGLGIVIGMDPSRGVLRLSTPVSPAGMAKVNTLFKGSFPVPSDIFVLGGTVDNLPYFTRESVDCVGAKPRPNKQRAPKRHRAV